MKIAIPELHIESVAAPPDIYLQTLSAVHFDGQQFVACNGHSLAVIPAAGAKADLPADGAVLIAAAAFAEARRLQAQVEVLPDGSALVTGRLNNEPVSSRFLRPSAPFPAWQKLVPSPAPPPVFAVDAELLARLVRAITTTPVVLLSPPVAPGKPIYVKPIRGDGYGLIMPVCVAGNITPTAGGQP